LDSIGYCKNIIGGSLFSEGRHSRHREWVSPEEKKGKLYTLLMLNGGAILPLSVPEETEARAESIAGSCRPGKLP